MSSGQTTRSRLPLNLVLAFLALAAGAAAVLLVALLAVDTLA